MNIYRRSTKADSVSAMLMDHMKSINVQLKKENLRKTLSMTRVQMAALEEYLTSSEFKQLNKFHIPKSRQEREEEARKLQDVKDQLRSEAKAVLSSR